MIEPENNFLSIRQQCDLLNINRSSLYYQQESENAYNLLLINLLDEEYTKHPFKGVAKMVAYLKELGYFVNHKRIRRLLRVMGLEAIYPKKNLSKANKNHKKYPYLLKGLSIEKPNEVWSTDITYIRMAQGFAYLVAIIDWYSRFVCNYSPINTKEPLCLAIARHLPLVRGECFSYEHI